MKNVYGWDKILINPRGRYSVTFQNLFTIIKFEFLIKLGIYRTFLKNFKQNILHTSFITYIILSSITITFIPKNCNLKSLPFSINNTFLLKPFTYLSSTLSSLNYPQYHSLLTASSLNIIFSNNTILKNSNQNHSNLFIYLFPTSILNIKKRHFPQFHKHSTLPSSIPIFKNSNQNLLFSSPFPKKFQTRDTSRIVSNADKSVARRKQQTRKERGHSRVIPKFPNVSRHPPRFHVRAMQRRHTVGAGGGGGGWRREGGDSSARSHDVPVSRGKSCEGAHGGGGWESRVRERVERRVEAIGSLGSAVRAAWRRVPRLWPAVSCPSPVLRLGPCNRHLF